MRHTLLRQPCQFGHTRELEVRGSTWKHLLYRTEPWVGMPSMSRGHWRMSLDCHCQNTNTLRTTARPTIHPTHHSQGYHTPYAPQPGLPYTLRTTARHTITPYAPQPDLPYTLRTTARPTILPTHHSQTYHTPFAPQPDLPYTLRTTAKPTIHPTHHSQTYHTPYAPQSNISYTLHTTYSPTIHPTHHLLAYIQPSRLPHILLLDTKL